MDLPSVGLRGAFGYALADVLANEQCLCAFADRVALFRNLFCPEAEAPSAAQCAKSLVRPYVIRGGYTTADSQTVAMEILLYGAAARLEPLIDLVVMRMAERGLGGELGSGRPCKVSKLGSGFEQPELIAGEQLIMQCLTPLRIRAQGRWCDAEIPFPALIARLTERYAQLVAAYGQADQRDWRNYSRDLTAQAETIRGDCLDSNNARARRWSTRSGDCCHLDGFVGSMLYRGNLAPFAELLGYLPFVHVGKAAAMGCGWVQLLDPADTSLYAQN